jgi:hypothetical protein
MVLKLCQVLDFESAGMLLDSAKHTRGRAADAVTQSSRFYQEDENEEEEEEEENSTPTAENKIDMNKGLGRLNRLTFAITSLLDDFTMVSFVPLNLKVRGGGYQQLHVHLKKSML